MSLFHLYTQEMHVHGIEILQHVMKFNLPNNYVQYPIKDINFPDIGNGNHALRAFHNFYGTKYIQVLSGRI